jgi:hypothetical protein
MPFLNCILWPYLTILGDKVAKCKSTILSMIRGSMGGITFLATQTQSMVMRARVSPTQPHTSYQEQLKVAFKQAVSWYKAFTQANVDAWNSYAANIWLSGPFGPYRPTGRQLMVGNIAMQQYLVARGAAFTGASHTMGIGATAPFTLPTVTVLAAASGHTGFKIHVVNNDAATAVVWCEISDAYSLTRNYFKGPFKGSTLLTADIATSGNHDFAFDIGPAGSVCWARVGCMDKATGQLRSQDVIIKAAIVTTA